MKKTWNSLRSGDCTDELSTHSITTLFFPRTCCAKHKKHNRREPGLFKEEFRCTDLIWLCSKTYCCYDSKSNNFKFSSKGLSERTLEDCGDGSISKYGDVFEEVLNVTSTHRGFRTGQGKKLHMSKQKQDCHTFIPNETFSKMEYTLVLSIYNCRELNIMY